MIFRNDDVSYKTEVGQFAEIQKLFKKEIILHTIALICKNIEKNPELITFINNNNIDVQIHCWEHYNFIENKKQLAADLPRCIKTIEKHFNHSPSIVYPPWNQSDDEVVKICEANGLQISKKKVSLSQYIRCEGDVEEDVINFHSWSYDEIIVLEKALKIYSKKR